MIFPQQLSWRTSKGNAFATVLQKGQRNNQRNVRFCRDCRENRDGMRRDIVIRIDKHHIIARNMVKAKVSCRPLPPVFLREHTERNAAHATRPRNVIGQKCGRTIRRAVVHTDDFDRMPLSRCDKLPRRGDNRIQTPDEVSFNIIDGNDDRDFHPLFEFPRNQVIDLPRTGRKVDANQRDSAARGAISFGIAPLADPTQSP